MTGKPRESVAKLQPATLQVAQLHPLTAANSPDTQGHGIARNPGMALDLGFLESMRNVNRSALERRVASLTKRRSHQGRQPGGLAAARRLLMDLTTLNSNDTDERVRRLCAKAINPFRRDIVEALGIGARRSARPPSASTIPSSRPPSTRSRAPASMSPRSRRPSRTASRRFDTRLREIEASVADGADEIDVVIPRGLVFGAKWQELYDEIVALRAACGEAHLKVILGTGDLATLRNVMLASMVAMMAGADFIKTSTGKESVNATLPVGLAMVRAIRAYFEHTGYLIGFKPAGGISTAKASLDWLVLMKEELGRPWLEPELFRFGASSLLTDIERQLEHHLTGHYSANHRHAMA